MRRGLWTWRFDKRNGASPRAYGIRIVIFFDELTGLRQDLMYQRGGHGRFDEQYRGGLALRDVLLCKSDEISKEVSNAHARRIETRS